MVAPRVLRRSDRAGVGGAGRRDRPETGTGLYEGRGESAARAVRRAGRTDGVAFGEQALPGIGHGNDPQLAPIDARPGLSEAFRRNGDLFAVRRPGRVVAEVREPPDRFPGGSHDEDAATVTLGS